MSLVLQKRKVENVTVVDGKGKITIGEGDVTLRSTIKDLLDSGEKQMILNLSDVKYMDSAGVGELVSTYTSVKNAGAKLILVGVFGKILNLLEITQLVKVFEVYGTVDEAIKNIND